MENKQPKALFDEARRALLDGRLRDALLLTRTLAASDGAPQGASEALEALLADFDRLLDYWEQGLPDP